MQYRVLATDYDGTLASQGIVESSTLGALRDLADAGCKLVMVTGRLLHEIQQICEGIELFDVVVAENGAVVWTEETGMQMLGAPVALDLVAELRRRRVTPLSVGRVIVSTWEDHEAVVVDTVRELGLDVELSHNKGSLMILPKDVDKGAGLLGALRLLRERPDVTLAVGDAENDLPLFEAAGCSAAVGNALDSVKAKASIVLQARSGAGVEELISAWLDDSLTGLIEVERAG